MTGPYVWLGFFAIVGSMLALDLFVFNRKAHEIKFKEAILTSLFWIGLSLVFNVGVYYMYGSQKALEFFTGFIIEKSLSVDNLFVFIMVFSYFNVPSVYQHKILFWGIIGAIVMRAIFIFTGVAIIQKFSWVIFVFGGLLIYTGFKMAFEKEKELHPEKNPVLRLMKRFIPLTNSHQGGHFFIKEGVQWMATPLFVVLLVVETTDVIFAVDSIPAILAISHDPFIVFTSNIFAILGLRALYFALSGLMPMFHYLK
jgi:tellurite resistance protein TerC